ncbi:MAG TPA: SHOCT domain-containing protein, partial [Thermohalobaculum sp.]|nr:SHOCT domain-containing protein [Thermohalobaculum sp.]
WQSGAAAAALTVAGMTAALAQPGDGYYGHPGMMGGWFGGLLMMLIFVALIVAAVVVTFRLLGHEPGKRSSGRALDILNERFARGEIDRAEYEDRRKALEGDGR